MDRERFGASHRDSPTIRDCNDRLASSALLSAGPSRPDMFAGQKVAILTYCPKAKKPLASIRRKCLALILGGLGRLGQTGRQ
jgi:hypothetical protein